LVGNNDHTHATDIDFGYIPQQCTGQIGDFVWLDSNANGIQDPGEPGIGGWTVQLTGPGGSPSVLTDANGFYLFQNLCQGAYTVNVTPQVGYVPTLYHQGVNPAVDSDANLLPVPVHLPTDSSTNFTIDFGFLNQCSGSIGDFVFVDTNENG